MAAVSARRIARPQGACMRPSLPTLGEPPKRSRLGSVVLFSLILGGAAGGAWWWKQNKGALPFTQPPPVAAATATPQDAGTVAAAAPTPPPTPVDPLVAAGLSRA